MNPPTDGTQIIAWGNIIETDDCLRTAYGFGPTVLCFVDGLWLTPNGLSLISCLGDEIVFHWWTLL